MPDVWGLDVEMVRLKLHERRSQRKAHLFDHRRLAAAFAVVPVMKSTFSCSGTG
jgi:hypothetical protein